MPRDPSDTLLTRQATSPTQPWWQTRLQLLTTQPPLTVPLSALDVAVPTLHLQRGGPRADVQMSMQDVGLLRPVVVRTVADGPLLQIVSGFRRCRAAVALGWSHIDAVVLEDLCLRDAYDLAVLEHLRERELSPLEQARLLDMSDRLGLRTEDSALRVMGLSVRRTRQLVGLLRLPLVLQTALERGDLALPLVLLLGRCWPDDHPDLHRWVADAAAARWSPSQLRAVLTAKGQWLARSSRRGETDVHDPRVRRVLRRRLTEALGLLDRLDNGVAEDLPTLPLFAHGDDPSSVV